MSTTTTVWGVIAKTVETSAEDMATPPRYRSTDVPNKKAWEPIAKGFKTAAKAAKYVGNILGIASAGINFTDSYDKWKKGDKWGATKSALKGVVDVALIDLKSNPVGLAVSIGWAVFSSWW